MNILILHNNNIPVDLRLSFKSDGNVFYSEVVHYQPYNLGDFDSFLCKRLSSLFNKKDVQYDIIILPYTFGEENYTEYSGLRVAAHIRLTEEWKHFATPILFIGGDNPIDVLRFSDLGRLLYTYRVYTSNARTKEELTNRIKHIDCGKIELSYNEWIATQKYQEFLDRINIKAPANYATHHSVANKWAVLRWIEMFDWSGNAPKFEDEGFRNMLYFKYLIAKAGQREPFKKKNQKKNPEILNIYDDEKSNVIKRKRIIYIDDEESMWSKVLSPIFQKSNVDFKFYPFVKRKISKKKLIQNIESFLKQDYDDNGGADCYLIDLRLHDDDFAEKTNSTGVPLSGGERLHDDDFAEKINSDQLSGQQIAKYIKDNLNKGCQIVIFTASNKSWNIEKSMESGACGYVIKESPELNYSRENSYMLFRDFADKIRTAFKQSYLQQMYKNLNDIDKDFKKYRININLLTLYEFVDLLDLDNGDCREIVVRSCALHLYVFLENLIANVLEFKVEASGQITKKCLSVGEKTEHRIIYELRKENGHKNVIKVKYNPEKIEKLEPLQFTSCYLEDRLSTKTPKKKDEQSDDNVQKSESSFDKIMAALLIHYKINESDVNRIVTLGYERNTSIAHGTFENNPMEIKDKKVKELRYIFNKVIVPILLREIEDAKKVTC